MVTFSDPLYSQQWHLRLLGDINTVWNEYSGVGISVGVYDDGLQYNHPDLDGNYNASLHFRFGGVTYNPMPISLVRDGHGTSVAGLIAAEAGNGIGGVGVAWGATLTGVNLLSDARFYDDSGLDIRAFRYFATFDVVNNSWGYDPYFYAFLDRGNPLEYGAAVESAFAYAALNGRDGLGTVIVKAAGNEALNANGEGLNGSRFVVSVAALDPNGQVQSYSNYGSNILVSAGAASVTTDLMSTGGYNTRSGGAGNYTTDFGGTSAATPVVTGVVALMLDANEDLGWRDVREILATSARLTGSVATGDESYEVSGTYFQANDQLGGTWNDGGRGFSLDYGFGNVDAFAAVRMAEIWSLFGEARTSSNEEHTTASRTNVQLNMNGGSGSVDVTVGADLRIEHIDLTISGYLSPFSSGREVTITLIAPDYTRFPVLIDPDAIVLPGDGTPLTWTFGISHALGLFTDGTWSVLFEMAGSPGLILNVAEVTLDFYGSDWDVDSVHHITQDFLLANSADGGDGRDREIDDNDGGNDWINMSSVADAVTASLDSLGQIVVDGQEWATIAAGAPIENIVTSDGADSLTGSSVANQIYAMRGNDTLHGMGGDDTVNGGTGNDSVDGGAGNDSVIGGPGNDTLAGGAGDDTLVGGVGVDVASYASASGDLTITLANGLLAVDGFGTDSLSGIEGLEGGSGDDSLTGDTGANLLVGGAGNDTLEGGAGNDTLSGGEGLDTASYAGATAGVTVSLALTAAQATGGAGSDVLGGIENLVGSSLNDVLTGSTGANRIEGGIGNDVITGGAGADTLLGGEGNDIFILGAFGDHLAGESIVGDIGTDELRYTGATAGTLILTSGVSLEKVVIGTGTGASAVLTGTTSINVDGAALLGAVTMIGNAGANRLIGGAGNDSLDGGSGNDTLAGGAGDDTLVGGVGVDVASYASASGDLTITLANGPLAVEGFGTDSLSGIEGLEGGSGHDSLTGDAGANLLAGGAGNDTLVGGAGNDTLSGGEGLDTASYAGAAAGVTVSLALSTAQATGGAGSDVLGGIENLVGSSLNDVLTGSTGANRIEGGIGNDVITGGAGADTLLGGEGNDIFVLGAFGDHLAGESIVGDIGTDELRYTGATAGTLILTSGVSVEKVVIGTGTGASAVLTGTTAINVDGAALLGAVTMIGNAGANRLIGGAGNDSLDGGSGNDTLAGGAGDDTLVGGAGVDVASYASASGDLTITLANGLLAVDGFGTDSLSGIEGLEGGSGHDSLTGDTGANLLAGGAGNDTLLGGAGNDTLSGGEGLDTASYAGATAGVTVSLALTAAQATGGAGSDVLSGIENLVGSGFNDVLTGSTGANRIEGGIGNDVITGGAGADTLLGGEGNDIFILGAFGDHLAGESIVGDIGTDELRYTGATAGTLVLTSGVSVEKVVIGTGTGASAVLTGTTAINVDGAALLGAVTMIGNAGANRLIGGAGNDSLDGGSGNDTLAGGAGDDTLVGGVGVDVASYASASGDLTITLANGPLAVEGFGTDSLSGIEGLEGGSGDDSLTGDAGANLLVGGAGNDTLVGGAGNDTLSGGEGLDTASYAGATAGVTVSLGLTAAQATGGAGSDVLGGIENLVGSSLNDVLTGSTGANRIEGGIGNDVITGGAGADTLLGGEGNDIFILSGVGAHAGDVITGGDGADELRYIGTTAATLVLAAEVDVERVVIGTGTGSSAVVSGTTAINIDASALAQGITLVGNAGANWLTGSAEADRLEGGGGSDSLIGAGGADKLIGGLGNDILTGGAAADEFIFTSRTSGVDVITDFNQLAGGGEQGDVLRFEGLGVGTFAYLGTGAFTGGVDNSEARVVGNQVLVDTNGDGTADITLTLTGLTNANQLGADDFLFV